MMLLDKLPEHKMGGDYLGQNSTNHLLLSTFKLSRLNATKKRKKEKHGHQGDSFFFFK
jgi:hydroxyacyl-ACP dehydratase HTD2-like protein with hotdog domain